VEEIMFKHFRVLALLALATGGLLGSGAATGNVRLNWLASAAAKAAEETIPFEIRVPADAKLELDGHKTKSKGVVRHFETPAMPTGHSYHYTVKVRHGDTVYSRVIHLEHGGKNVFDFRTDPTPVKAADKPVRAPLEVRPAKVAVKGKDKQVVTTKATKRTRLARHARGAHRRGAADPGPGGFGSCRQRAGDRREGLGQEGQPDRQGAAGGVG
jgi:uncharacterized protein (TIGR03000 family)